MRNHFGGVNCGGISDIFLSVHFAFALVAQHIEALNVNVPRDSVSDCIEIWTRIPPFLSNNWQTWTEFGTLHPSGDPDRASASAAVGEQKEPTNW